MLNNRSKKELFSFGLIRIIEFYSIFFLFFVAKGIYAVILPVYLNQRGFSYGQIGVIFSSYGIGMAMIKVIVGRHSDIVGRKVYLSSALFVQALAKLLIIFSTTSEQLAALLALDGVCYGVYSAMRAPLIRDFSFASNRGKAYGWVTSVSTAGVALGSLIGGFSGEHFGFGASFIFSSSVLVIACILSIISIQETKKQNGDVVTNRVNKRWILLRVHKTLLILCLINFIQNFVNAPIFQFVIPMYITSIFGLSASFLGIVYGVDNFLSAISSLQGGILSDRIDARKILLASTLVIGIAAIVLLFIPPVFPFILVFLIFSGVFSFSSPVLEKIESENVREAFSGFDFGLISLSVSLGIILGNTVVGILMEKIEEAASFVVLGVGYGCVALLILPLLKKNK